ncbi:MAG: SDR family NAD(P)-dependent oxidoreductase [Inquilinaceae bacterium]
MQGDERAAAFARYPSLRDRVVFVSGGGSGIGASLVAHFCAQGAKVAFVDIDEAASRTVIRDVTNAGDPPPLFVPCDLRDIEALRAAVGRAREALGPIGVLVNNAANDTRHDAESVTVDYWDDRMAVNLRHQFFAIQAVLPDMKELGGGSIINFGSISWMIGNGGMPAYTTAKAAVMGLTRGMARDLGPHRIRVNTLSPGWIMTQRQMDLWFDEAGQRMLDANQFLKDKLYPADVARVVLFLAADDSRMCTGQNYIVDGGWA